MRRDRRLNMEALREGLLSEYAYFCRISKVKVADYSLFQSRLVKGLPLRGYFSILFHEYLISNRRNSPFDMVFVCIHVPFIVEGLMSLLYYDNAVFDSKFDINTDAARKRFEQEKRALHQHLLAYIGTQIADELLRTEMIDFVNGVYETVFRGQLMEQQFNHYESWLSPVYLPDANGLAVGAVDEKLIDELSALVMTVYPVSEAKIPFLKSYLTRVYVVNAVLFVRIAEFMMRHLKVNDKEKAKLLRFSKLFGVMLQIVNDCADFVPASEEESTSTKFCCDALSDLRNKNVTLPVIFALENDDETIEMRKYLGGKSIFLSDTVYSEEIIRSHSVFYAMRVGKQINKLAMECFGARKSRVVKYFRDMADVANNNRFYRHYYEFDNAKPYKAFKRSSKKRNYGSKG